jgi:hypothetical protein
MCRRSLQMDRIGVKESADTRRITRAGGNIGPAWGGYMRK